MFWWIKINFTRRLNLKIFQNIQSYLRTENIEEYVKISTQNFH